MSKEVVTDKKWRLLIIIYAAILVVPHFLRIFDNNFWGDEAYTILLAKMPMAEMVKETASDVHPPLYYLIVKIIGWIFGYRYWSFHLASLLAYLITVVITVTYMYRRFGAIVSTIFLTCISVLPNTFTYNVEVRNYSYGALFVLLTYLAFENILRENRRKDYVLFTVFGLCAAYTHYYCLISVAFLYVVMLIFSFVKGKERTIKALVASGVTVACYLPWLLVLFGTLKRTTGDFWMKWIPTSEDCLSYLFYGKGSWIIFGALILLSLVYLVSNLQAMESKKTKSDPTEKNTAAEKFTYDVVWMFAAALSVFGTMFVGIMVSRIIRPMFITRYLYPVSVLAWFALAYVIANIKGRVRVLIMVFIVGLVFLSSFSDDWEIVEKEYQENKLAQETLSKMDVWGTDRIITDLQAIDWTVSDYYFPNVEHTLISQEDLPELSGDGRYWFILNEGTAGQYEDNVVSQGYTFERVAENGTIGTLPVDVYLVTAK